MPSIKPLSHISEFNKQLPSSTYGKVPLWLVPLFNDITVYPEKYAHGFVVFCFVVVMQSFIINSHEVFIHTHQGCFAGTGATVRLPQCQWSKSDGYGKISQCITTTKHNKAKTVCKFLGIYCTYSIGMTATERRLDFILSLGASYGVSIVRMWGRKLTSL